MLYRLSSLFLILALLLSPAIPALASPETIAGNPPVNLVVYGSEIPVLLGVPGNPPSPLTTGVKFVVTITNSSALQPTSFRFSATFSGSANPSNIWGNINTPKPGGIGGGSNPPPISISPTCISIGQTKTCTTEIPAGGRIQGVLEVSPNNAGEVIGSFTVQDTSEPPRWNSTTVVTTDVEWAEDNFEPNESLDNAKAPPVNQKAVFASLTRGDLDCWKLEGSPTRITTYQVNVGGAGVLFYPNGTYCYAGASSQGNTTTPTASAKISVPAGETKYFSITRLDRQAVPTIYSLSVRKFEQVFPLMSAYIGPIQLLVGNPYVGMLGERNFSFQAEAGKTYIISVGSVNPTDNGDYMGELSDGLTPTRASIAGSGFVMMFVAPETRLYNLRAWNTNNIMSQAVVLVSLQP